ncbi:D-aminoacyl-tRNA deacylase [Thiovibrio frasassiensis]|jgi:D-tyrosyl-tRNA(Tyr) deacylase|uniref:D-aminoacyl-tRNA deacylase n=1 Tax=Thiovibrio frasassiensis TaxID=2984131 RepID=A0A9X4MKL6_9BACT|nr:D-aminoacyl-tRNA deacylase [Thiovibrio frasassiensis]MDG4474542.1 D-aminoacyl-tRNA deacylase [Thiovibrio frasassiensis]
MRAVVQRVSQASVHVDGEICGAIGPGLLVLLGVGKNDAEQDAALLADKIANLRIFEDTQGLMNLSLLEVQGEILVVSQFTLFGDCRKGRRPSYSTAAPPAEAAHLYEQFIREIRTKKITVATGKFQAMMDVTLVNNGPVTLLLDTEKQF